MGEEPTVTENFPICPSVFDIKIGQFDLMNEYYTSKKKMNIIHQK